MDCRVWGEVLVNTRLDFRRSEWNTVSLTITSYTVSNSWFVIFFLLLEKLSYIFLTLKPEVLEFSVR